MAEKSFKPANHRREIKTCKSNNSSVNLRATLPNKPGLKSSIPKPSPSKVKDQVSNKHSSSSLSKLILPSRIPTPVSRSADRTSGSVRVQSPCNIPPKDLQLNRYLEKRTQTKILSRKPRECSNSTSIHPYAKGKVFSKPTTSQVKSRYSHYCQRKSPTTSSNLTKNSELKAVEIKPTTTNEWKISSEENLDQKKRIFKIYNELMKLQPSKEFKSMQKEICKILHDNIMELTESIKVKTPFLSECSPVFLVTFEKHMQDITEMWLHLLFNLLTNKTTVVNSPQLDLKINIRAELKKLLCSLPCDKGQVLHKKLQIIDKELLKATKTVIQKATSLFQQNEELKDSCFRLEKIQEQTHFELKEQIAILAKENQELDRKYEKAIDMNKKEKSKTEQQEKFKVTINKELTEVSKLLKIIEGKREELDIRTKKAEAICKALESSVRNKGVISEKENRNQDELLNKFNESEITIEKLKLEIMESNAAKNSLMLEVKELNEQLLNKTTAIEDLEQQRNYLKEELAAKSTKTKFTANEMRSICNDSTIFKDDITSNVLIEDLTKDVYQKNAQILDLRKKLSKVDHLLKEKEVREKALMRQVLELKKHPQQCEALLQAQIKDINYELKSITEEKGGLEKMVVQKTLEMNQRDQLVKQHAQVLRARDVLIPMFQNREKRKQTDFVEKLCTVVNKEHFTNLSHGDDEYSSNRLEPDLTVMIESSEKQNSLDSVERELSFRQEKMAELYSLLEAKQIELSRLEHRLTELQGVHEEKVEMEKEKEARISFLQRELQERKVGKSKGIFSLFSGQDGYL